MSKASEWAAARYALIRQHAEENMALPPPRFKLANVVGDVPLRAEVESANGDPMVNIQYEAPWQKEAQIRMGAKEALALARWMLDTFGEANP